MDTPLKEYTKNPRLSIKQRATGIVKDYWVITSLAVAIFSIILYFIVSKLTNISHDVIPPSESNWSNFNDDSSDPSYWISGFEKGGHFSNFTSVIIEELARNFAEVDKGNFRLNVSDGVLNRENQKLLFNYTEELVKGMKFISMQEDSLNSKLQSFFLAQNEFSQCEGNLLKNNLAIEEESDELKTANKTIAYEELILEQLQQELAQLKQARIVQANKTSIDIDYKIKEKEQSYRIFESTVDKDQVLKDLEIQLSQASSTIEELQNLIVLLKEEAKMKEDKFSQNQNLIQILEKEISEIEFNIDRLQLDQEIGGIVGRVKRDEHISNTKNLTETIQKRIKLINSYKIHNSEISPELLETFNNDKEQLKSLNVFQINLIRSFRKQTNQFEGKTIDQLTQELALKKQQKVQSIKEVNQRDQNIREFEDSLLRLENLIKEHQEQMADLQDQINELKKSTSEDGESSAERLKQKVKLLEDQISKLKQQREREESTYQEKLKDLKTRIDVQKEQTNKVKASFSKQINKRQTLEKGILSELNKCRSYRYLMETIYQSAQENQDVVTKEKEKLLQIKKELYKLLDIIIPTTQSSLEKSDQAALPDGTEQIISSS